MMEGNAPPARGTSPLDQALLPTTMQTEIYCLQDYAVSNPTACVHPGNRVHQLSPERSNKDGCVAETRQ